MYCLPFAVSISMDPQTQNFEAGHFSQLAYDLGGDWMRWLLFTGSFACFIGLYVWLLPILIVWVYAAVFCHSRASIAVLRRQIFSAVTALLDHSYDAEVMQGERTMMFFCESTLDAKPILDGCAAHIVCPDFRCLRVMSGLVRACIR